MKRHEVVFHEGAVAEGLYDSWRDLTTFFCSLFGPEGG